MSFAQLLENATASEATRPEICVLGTDFVYDLYRYGRLADVHQILEDECFFDLSDNERVERLDHRDLMDRGVNVRALAQRIDEAGEENTLDIADVFAFVNNVGDINWLNDRLRSTMPTDVLATALGTGADELSKFFVQFGGLANEHGEPIIVPLAASRALVLADAAGHEADEDDEGFVHDAEA